MPDETYDEPDNTEARVIASYARQATKPHELDPAKPYAMLLEEGDSLDTLDLESFLPAPRRKRGTYSPADTDSFIAYVARHKDDEHTTIWVNPDAAQVLAVVNDNAPGETGWGDHKVRLQLTRTPEWQHWLDKDGRYMGQEDFADHIQEGIVEIGDPPSADMLEIAQSFQGSTNADWKSASRLDNGAVGFTYQEEVQASAGRKGELEIPATFTLNVSPFLGEDPVQIAARLRYRIRQGVLAIGYKLERPHELELEVLKTVQTNLSGMGFKHVYLGAAPQC